MKTVIGIDVGGSRTKICGFSDDMKLIGTDNVKSSDQTSSIYGAFGKFTTKFGIPLCDIEKVFVTGVGHYSVGNQIYGIPTFHAGEFDCIGLGGKYLAGLDKALVISIGTGTAMVYSDEKGSKYLGGTGVGGGTIIGLSHATMGISEIHVIEELASKGDLGNVNLRISDITDSQYSPSLSPTTTASNFGKISDRAEKEDIAAGVLNLVFETIGMLGVFASKNFNTNSIVLLGHLPQLGGARATFESVGKMFGVEFIIPDESTYGTSIGAALHNFNRRLKCGENY